MLSYFWGHLISRISSGDILSLWKLILLWKFPSLPHLLCQIATVYVARGFRPDNTLSWQRLRHIPQTVNSFTTRRRQRRRMPEFISWCRFLRGWWFFGTFWCCGFLLGCGCFAWRFFAPCRTFCVDLTRWVIHFTTRRCGGLAFGGESAASWGGHLEK